MLRKPKNLGERNRRIKKGELILGNAISYK